MGATCGPCARAGVHAECASVAAWPSAIRARSRRPPPRRTATATLILSGVWVARPLVPVDAFPEALVLTAADRRLARRLAKAACLCRRRIGAHVVELLLERGEDRSVDLSLRIPTAATQFKDPYILMEAEGGNTREVGVREVQFHLQGRLDEADVAGADWAGFFAAAARKLGALRGRKAAGARRAPAPRAAQAKGGRGGGRRRRARPRRAARGPAPQGRAPAAEVSGAAGAGLASPPWTIGRCPSAGAGGGARLACPRRSTVGAGCACPPDRGGPVRGRVADSAAGVPAPRRVGRLGAALHRVSHGRWTSATARGVNVRVPPARRGRAGGPAAPCYALASFVTRSGGASCSRR